MGGEQLLNVSSLCFAGQLALGPPGPAEPEKQSSVTKGKRVVGPDVENLLRNEQALFTQPSTHLLQPTRALTFIDREGKDNQARQC